MKLYHYAPKENTCLQKGILSVSLLPECLFHYASRAGSEKHSDIIKWLDKTFRGRSRSVSCFTEPLKLNGKIIANAGHLFSFDIDELIRDNLIEAFKKINPSEIDYSPLDFSLYKTEFDLTNTFFRHYMVVLKNGFIPARYITLEK